jgi:hypothetical protein
VTGESLAKWYRLENRRNRIAEWAAIVAGAVAVEHQAKWGHHSEMSAYPEHTRTGQIWIIPGGETAQREGYIIAESR